jgi:hypothetical protein
MKQISQIPPLKFFERLRWIDKKPLLDFIEAYRRTIFNDVLFTFDADGRPTYSLAVMGRAKKNWKSADTVLACLYRLTVWQTTGGHQVYLLANDLGQAADDLVLAKKLVRVNPFLLDSLAIKKDIIERRDGDGFLEILPAGDAVGLHGKTYLMVGYDEVHGHRDWSVIEGLQPDPHRLDVLQWFCSYASLYDRPGAPLHDLCKMGWSKNDPGMYFDWHSAARCTDPACDGLSPEEKANPSLSSFADEHYLEKQKLRLPFYQYRRLHLNLGGQPEGSAFVAEKIEAAIERGVQIRQPVENVSYFAFCDMSGGSSDDAGLAVAHKEQGRIVLDLIIDQGPRPPFDPRQAVTRFAETLYRYKVTSIMGDKYAGLTFRQDFERHGIHYEVCDLTKSQLYEQLEPRLNANEVVLLDVPKLESQLLGLIWRNNRIDHGVNEHDDLSNSVAGAVYVASIEKKRGVYLLGDDLEVWGS